MGILENPESEKQDSTTSKFKIKHLTLESNCNNEIKSFQFDGNSQIFLNIYEQFVWKTNFLITIASKPCSRSVIRALVTECP